MDACAHNVYTSNRIPHCRNSESYFSTRPIGSSSSANVVIRRAAGSGTQRGLGDKSEKEKLSEKSPSVRATPGPIPLRGCTTGQATNYIYECLPGLAALMRWAIPKKQATSLHNAIPEATDAHRQAAQTLSLSLAQLTFLLQRAFLLRRSQDFLQHSGYKLCQV